ncbi:MAG TPA: FlgD immunoglobulin-like domain containing protein [bacterium]|nr:FlgD immunoglobulin-like domain containing protein [bacterium]HQG44436.1 FlgD immunoglobulin-like domain containing protein [bacterium]HQI48350.1 FlgD immunoglobulin-like domain containing protein [bacterium]HQJ63452.1 FlgD immunoglobulin-like domain containing protein [bacterium]
MKAEMRLGVGLLLCLTPLTFGAEVVLQLGTGSGKVGTQHNVVQVTMANDTTVIALQLEVADVPDFIRPDSVWTTERTSGFTVAWKEDSLSILHILLLSMDATSSIARGSGAVLNISYTVQPGADQFKDLDLVFFTTPKVVAPGSVKIPAVGLSGKFMVGNTAVGEHSGQQPGRFLLAQNFPNPFNPETRVAFQLPERQQARLEIYNLLGQRIRTLVEGELAAGGHAATWDGLTEQGEPAAGGIYLYRLQAGPYHDCKRMVLMR